MTLLEARHLVKAFPLGRNLLGRARTEVRAVDDVSFTLEPGRGLALVGESGAGKSTTGRLVLRLLEPDSGEVHFEGNDITRLPRSELRRLRRSMQMIFQDPYSSLDARMSIIDNTSEPLLVHFRMGRKDRYRQATEWLERVGLSSDFADRYPEELSGGQLQRVSIARALTLRPKLLVCDEPTAALDVSIQAQVVNLMVDLQEDLGLAYLFISHNLALVRAVADDIAVMKDGAIVEIGSADEILDRPTHPYTVELLASVPEAVAPT